MDYKAFCRSFTASSGIDTALFCGEELVYSSLCEHLGCTSEYRYVSGSLSINPFVVADHETTFFGLLDVKGTDYHLIVGPAFNIPVNQDMIHLFIYEQKIPPSLWTQMGWRLKAIPTTTYAQMENHMAFLYLCLNGEALNGVEHFNAPYYEEQKHRSERHLSEMIAQRDENIEINTYYYELGLYRQIQSGSVEALEAYLQSSPAPILTGQLASLPLRQSKDVFIAAVSKMSLLGAIQGGMDIEQAYQLTGQYIRECESLHSIDKVNSLFHAALVEFCEAVKATHLPPVLSSDVQQCVTYVRNHLHERIKVGELADKLQRSNSYIFHKFKEEMGVSLNAFAAICRLDEAKNLLLYSDKPLSEISAYLCFATQSHFQNAFKKAFGITPLQYRKQERKYHYRG